MPIALQGPTVVFKEPAGKELREICPLLCLTPLLSHRRLLFLAFLQIAVLILVLLKRDILNWVLPPKLAAAFGSPPARPWFF